MCIVSSLQYLCAQGLAVRGHTEETGNFDNLQQLRANDDAALKSWLDKSGYRWLSPTIQNEIIQALFVLHSFNQDMMDAKYFAIIMDEKTDASCTEQVSICIPYVTQNLKVQETFKGFYETTATNARSIVWKCPRCCHSIKIATFEVLWWGSHYVWQTHRSAEMNMWHSTKSTVRSLHESFTELCISRFCLRCSTVSKLIRLENWLILSGNPQNVWLGLHPSSSKTQEISDRCVLLVGQCNAALSPFWITILNYWVFLKKFQTEHGEAG